VRHNVDHPLLHAGHGASFLPTAAYIARTEDLNFGSTCMMYQYEYFVLVRTGTDH
jgi:hypothetical protein